MSNLLFLSCLLLGAAVAAEEVFVDDFTRDEVGPWESSTSPEYYRGGQGQGGLSLGTAEGVRGLRCVFGFGDPAKSEPIFITRHLKPATERLPIRKVRFRYRWEVDEPAGATRAPLDPAGGFKVRLRTSPTTFTDYDVPAPADGWPVGQWVDVELDTNLLGPRVRNIYNLIFAELSEPSRVIQLTFRLDDQDDLNARGALWLADIRFEIEHPAAEGAYRPMVSERQPGERFTVLNVVHHGDGFYDFEQAAQIVDPSAAVTTAPFRGLHFPIWEFPVSREKLLAFDGVILADVDPWVFTAEQLRHLADAVHSGVGLLVCGGPNSLTHARRQSPVLADLLPVTFEPGAKLVAANATPRVAGEHPLTAGLDAERLGTVGQVNALAPKPDATVLLTAGDHPLLVAGQAGRGRVLVLNTWAQPNSLADPRFMNNAHWPILAARLLAWLAGRALPEWPAAAPAVRRVRADWLYGLSAFAPGWPFGVVVRPSEGGGTITATLRAGGEPVWEEQRTAGGEPITLGGTLPELAAGPLELRVSAPGYEPAVLTGSVVDPFERADFYPIITYLPYSGGGHFSDGEKVEATVRDAYEHGFNTIALGGFGSNTTGSLHAELRGRAERIAYALGMASIQEYTRFTEYSREGRYSVSPFDPAFEAKLAERVAAGIEQCRYRPRLLSVKYVDEPFLGPNNLDDGPATRAAFERLTGLPYVERQALPDDPAARYAYGRFLSAYLEQDFAVGQRLKSAAGAPWDLLQTYCSPGYGAGRALDGFEDAYRWTRPADRFDFDVYPYFYPTSDRLRFVQANWCFAASRTIARALGKPWGFYIELDDRNYPYQINPAEASAECAFTAVAAGADYLNSFIHQTFATGSGARPERWARCGEALRAIRRLGPLLVRAKRQPARVAVLLAETHQLVHNGWKPPLYSLALLGQAAGDADVLHEAALEHPVPPELRAIYILGADALSREAFERLTAWVAAGGELLLDHLPTIDERGRPLPWPPMPADQRRVNLGDGHVTQLLEPLEPRLTRAVESGDDALWQQAVEELRTSLAQTLAGPSPVVTAQVLRNRLQTDVGVRTAGQSAMIIVVNHDPAPQEVEVELTDWPFRPAWVLDLVTGEELPGALTPDGKVILRQAIPGRWARLVGVYAARPTTLAIALGSESVRRGGPLAYRVTLHADGAPAAGVHLLSLTVRGPDGRVHSRLGGERSAVDGVCEVAGTVPLNIPPGDYTVRAETPFAGLVAEARVRIE